MSKTTKCIIMTRVSTDLQELDIQEEECIKMAVADGYINDKEHIILIPRLGESARKIGEIETVKTRRGLACFDNLCSLIIERMKGWLNAVLFSFCTSLFIQKTETTKYFRSNIILNIQNAIRIPIIIITFALPIGGSV